MSLPNQRRGQTARQHAVTLRAAENRQKAIEMRIQGASYKQIGLALEVSTQMAFKYVQGELDRLATEAREGADRIRQMELMRLDRLELALWDSATGNVGGVDGALPPNLGSVDRIIKIMERRSKLLGLDAPATINKNITVTEADRMLLIEQIVSEATEEDLEEAEGVYELESGSPEG